MPLFLLEHKYHDKDSIMKKTKKVSETSSGAIASVAVPLGKTIKRKTLESQLSHIINSPMTFQQKRVNIDQLLEAEEKAESDAEVDQAIQFAKTHYPGLDPESAFRKLVVRSLKHAEEDSTKQDDRISELEATMQELQDSLEAVLDQVDTLSADGDKTPQKASNDFQINEGLRNRIQRKVK